MTLTLEERAFLSVKHSDLDYRVVNSLMRAKIEDFSELFIKNTSSLEDIRGIGKTHADSITKYLLEKHKINLNL